MTRRHQTLVSSLKALPRNLSCRPLNEGCVKAEIRSTKASFLCRCLCDTDRSARKTLGYASDDDSAKHYQNSAALHYFMRRTTISHFAFLIQAKLSNGIKGQYAPGANREPDTLLSLSNLFIPHNKRSRKNQIFSNYIAGNERKGAYIPKKRGSDFIYFI